MASWGLLTSAMPSPSPSLPMEAHVESMNWLMPLAAAVDSAWVCQPDSCWICAAMSGGVISGHRLPARWTSST